MTQLLAIEGAASNVAGALVYWTLSGNIDLDDLRDALEFNGLGDLCPEPPTKETVLYRAAINSVSGKRQLVRPLGKRGQWTFVTERVVEDGETTEYDQNVRMYVEHNEDSTVAHVIPQTEEDRLIADKISANCKIYDGILTAVDVSNWLIRTLIHHVHAVGLRERGGFYFVPRDRMETWRKLYKVICSLSDHKIYEIPAVRSDEAVEAILAAVRFEANYHLTKMENYFAGDVSTRRLNSIERTIDQVKGKLQHYADLLGVTLPDFNDKLEQLTGAVGAARAIIENEKKAP